MRHRLEILSILDDLSSTDHHYREFEDVIGLSSLARPLQNLYSEKGRPELGAERAFRMFILQFLEDLSDREMERFMGENLSAKWFCDFGISERTPDHSFFGGF